MNIAIIGAGRVGSALGPRLVDAGHPVTFGVRDPGAPRHRHLPGTTGSPAEAAVGAEVVVLATPWENTETAVRSLGDLGGRILVDATNPLAADLRGLDPAATPSGGELVAKWATGGRVVKMFNTTGSANLADPRFPAAPLTMPYAGDDADAKEIVGGLCAALGFDPLDCGPLASSAQLEHLALLWIRLAYVYGNGPDIGWALLRR